jgi:hypothetical protein
MAIAPTGAQDGAPTRAGVPAPHDDGMETMLEAVERLRDLGFVADLAAVDGARLRCPCGTVSDADVLTAVHTVRFEGDSNPDDEEILVAVRLPCGHAGQFSAAYGPSADGAALAVLRSIRWS